MSHITFTQPPPNPSACPSFDLAATFESATWPCANNGCFTNVFVISDGGDDGQGAGGGAGNAGRVMVVMVIVLVTVMVAN